MKAKSTFLAWSVLPSPTWAPGSTNDDGPGLPMAAHGGNIRPVRRIIRWMSDKTREADHLVDVGLHLGIPGHGCRGR
jgi:hypothetical protein